MAGLVLIDLESQYEAVAEYVKGWKIEDILRWMNNYGEVVQKTDPYGSSVYVFHSRLGKRDAFYFNEIGELFMFKSGWLM